MYAIRSYYVYIYKALNFDICALELLEPTNNDKANISVNFKFFIFQIVMLL